MTPYKDAIDEYIRTDQNKTVYAYFGLAVYHAQCVEEMFVSMLYLHRINNLKDKTQQNIRKIINKIDASKNTMGNFVGEVKQVYSLTDELEETLEKKVVSQIK